MHLLDDFQTISKKSVMKFDFHTTSSKKEASIALYTALVGTMTNCFFGEFRLYNNKIVNQGPRLLFKILTQFSIQDSRVRADVQQEIFTLGEVFKSTNWNVHLVCPILHERLLVYDNTGGDSNVRSYVGCQVASYSFGGIFVGIHDDGQTVKISAC